MGYGSKSVGKYYYRVLHSCLSFIEVLVDEFFLVERGRLPKPQKKGFIPILFEIFTRDA